MGSNAAVWPACGGCRRCIAAAAGPAIARQRAGHPSSCHGNLLSNQQAAHRSMRRSTSRTTGAHMPLVSTRHSQHSILPSAHRNMKRSTSRTTGTLMPGCSASRRVSR